MQLDLFAIGDVPAPAVLRSAPVPDLALIAARVGNAERWEQLTLTQVLDVWHDLYDEFVAALEEPLAHARRYTKPGLSEYDQASAEVRRFYKREADRLASAQQRGHALADELFAERMLAFHEQGKACLRKLGAAAADVDDSDDFFGQVFLRPEFNDLSKLMPVLAQDLAQEYLRLLARSDATP